MNEQHLTPLVLINELCEQFRQQWRSGDAPDMAEYLNSLPDGAHETLLRNLLPMDIEFRRRNGENPTSTQYIERFPRFARLIRQAFYESTLVSLEAVVDKQQQAAPGPAKDRTQIFRPPVADRLGHYRLLRELGRGGFGIVYEAQHIHRQHRVALKTLPLGDFSSDGSDADRLHRFRREFRSLADTNHPNLVGMQTLEVDGNQWFFTMDLVDGVDFHEYVRPNNTLDEKRLRAALAQIVNGVMALHGQRIIHRDLKPSNVLVGENDRVKILDFGLVAELVKQTDETMTHGGGQIAGTPVYAAPEQLLGKYSANSDWYAVGVMLYEALTGERPFRGTLVEIFDQKKNGQPPSLEGRSGVPADLASLASELMSQHPGDRPDALAITRLLCLETESKTEFRESQGDQNSQLIGRTPQLQELTQHYCRVVDQQRPHAVFITGRSGEGKSSLADKFLEPLRKNRNVVVLSGRCYDRETVPFKAIDCLIDSLVTYLRGLESDQLEKLLPEDTPILAQLFPVLARVEAISENKPVQPVRLDSKQMRSRAFNALCELLFRIARETTVVIFNDDLQWGDSDSAGVLFHLLTSKEASKIFFIGSFRSDEAEQSPFLTNWEELVDNFSDYQAQSTVSVGPLDEEQCTSMVVSQIGNDTAAIRDRAAELFQSTGGNPYFLQQLIDCYDADSGEFTPVPLSEAIGRKLSRLPEEADRLLEVLAVAGQSTSLDEIGQVAGLDSTFATITHMRTEQLVRLIGSEQDPVVDTYHDKIRETILDSLDTETRKERHLAFGDFLEKLNSVDSQHLVDLIEDASKDLPAIPRVFDLAFHFEAGGDSRKSLIYSLLAGELASDQSALPNAIESFQTAKKHIQFATPVCRFRILFGLGNALMLAGRYEQANELLQQASESACDRISEIRARCQQADIIYKTGSLKESIDAYEILLKKIGCPVPPDISGPGSGNPIQHVDPQQIDATLDELTLDHKNSGRMEMLIHLLMQFTYPCMFREPNKVHWATTLSDELASRLEKRSLRVLSASMRVYNYGWFHRDVAGVTRYAAVSSRYAEELNDRYGKALSFLTHGISIEVNGDYEQSVEKIKVAIDLFEELGDVWRSLLAQSGLAGVYAERGDYRDARRLAQPGFQRAIQFGQHRMAMTFLYAWLRSTTASFPLEPILATFQWIEDDLMFSARTRAAVAEWYLENQRYETALAVAKSGLASAREYDPQQGYVAPIFAVYAQVLREASLWNRMHGLPNAVDAEEDARDAARHAIDFTKKSTCGYPKALREMAHHLADDGDLREAMELLNESCEVAEHQGARHEAALSRKLLGEIGKQRGTRQADEWLRKATAQLQEFKRRKELATQESLVAG